MPISIENGWTRGTLFSGCHYPAMQPGDDCVLGEIWTFSQRGMPTVIRQIDAVEGADRGRGYNLYERVVVDVFALNGEKLRRAYTYHYAADLPAVGFTLVRARRDGFVQWRVVA